MNKGVRPPGPTAIAMKELMLVLHTAPRTKYELKDLTGVCNTTISRWMGMLHRAQLIYIVSWERTGQRGAWAARWQYGYQKTDAVRPKALSSSEYNKRARAKAANAARTTKTEGVIRHVAD